MGIGHWTDMFKDSNKIAVIFPGQAAQYPGMGKSLYEGFDLVKRLFSRAGEVLGLDVADVCFNATDEQLKDTYFQQLAIFTVSAAAFEVLKVQASLPAAYFAGLSLGEYTCLYAAGVLSFEDTLFLLDKRAKAMQQAGRESNSAMLAVIGLDLRSVEKAAGRFFISNLNAPGQVVISVSRADIQDVKAQMEQLGAKAVIELKVSAGFHSPFMQQAENMLKSAAEKIVFHRPSVPIVSNVDAKPHIDPEEIKENIIKQLTHPVLWQKSIEYIKSRGVGVFWEVGPAKVLKGLLRKIDKSLRVDNFENVEDFLLKEKTA